MLPHQTNRVIRITSHLQWTIADVKPKKQLKRVRDENIWLTTTGIIALAQLVTLLRQCQSDRALFSIECSILSGRMSGGLQFLRDLKDSGMFDDQTLERIAYQNAENILKIKVEKRSHREAISVAAGGKEIN